jgi:hypothetical protein
LICCSGSHWIGKIERFAIRSNGFSILSQHAARTGCLLCK